MRELAIYFVRDDGDHMAFLCLGRLCDHLRENGYKITHGRGRNAQQVIITPSGETIMHRREILSCTDEEYAQILHSDVVNIAKEEGDGRAWGIYKVPGIDDLWGVDRRKGEAPAVTAQYAEKRNHVAEIRQLDVKSIPELKFPVKAHLQSDSKGRLFCRINLHPELNGTTGYCKLCFPHREWTDINEGEAIITSCTELDAYCFVQGHMVKYTLPDPKAVALWLSSHNKASSTVFTVLGSSRGDYYGFRDAQTSEYRRLYVKDGEVHSSLYYQMMDDLASTQVETKTAAQFAVDAIFGAGRETPETFAAKFEHSEFSPVNGREERQLACEWRTTNVAALLTPLVSKGIKLGAIKCYEMAGYNLAILEVVPENFVHLVQFTEQELNELVANVKTYNNSTDGSIKALIQKERLHLLNRP